MFSTVFRLPQTRSAVSTCTGIAGLLTVAVSVNAWTANNAVVTSLRRAITPSTMTTLAEAGPSRMSFFSTMTRSAKKTSEESGEKRRAFYPQDVYYDSKVKGLLETLRSKKRDEIVDDDIGRIGCLTKSGQKYMGTLTLIGYKGGSLESQINQDRAMVVSPFLVGDETEPNDETVSAQRKASSKLLGCFDGHARLGEVVSEYVVKTLPELLASKLESIQPKEDPQQISKALTETFVELDKTAPAEISGGCTASVVLQRGSKLYVANAGDSRSFVVAYRAQRKEAEVVYISREDKPSLADERERIEKMGGKVLIPPHGTSRVLYTDPTTKITSGLAMSRSIGDWEVGRLGVIPDPIVKIVDIEEVAKDRYQSDGNDDVFMFAVSATDGLMDYVTPEGIAKVVAMSMYEKNGHHLLTALEQLIFVAAMGWERTKRGTYRDDIAISVCEIRIPPSLR